MKHCFRFFCLTPEVSGMRFGQITVRKGGIKERQGRICRHNRAVGITAPLETCQCRLFLFLCLIPAIVQIGGGSRHHVLFEQGDFSLLITYFADTFQLFRHLVLITVHGAEVGGILIVSPCPFYFRYHFFFHHPAIISTCLYLSADQCILVKRSQQRTEALFESKFLVLLVFSVELSP